MRGWSTSWPRNSGRLDGRLPLETTFNIRGERGSIDVFGFHLPTGTVVVIEVKSVVPDVQATLLVLDRKTRLAREIARQLGWTARAVARVLVVGDGRTTRRRVASHRAIFAAAFPHRTIAVKRWLRSPDTERAVLRPLVSGRCSPSERSATSRSEPVASRLARPRQHLEFRTRQVPPTRDICGELPDERSWGEHSPKIERHVVRSGGIETPAGRSPRARRVCEVCRRA